MMCPSRSRRHSTMRHFGHPHKFRRHALILSFALSRGVLGHSYEWINGQKPHLKKDGIWTICNTENFVIMVLGLSSSSSGSSSTYGHPMTGESFSHPHLLHLQAKFRFEESKMLTLTFLQCQCLVQLTMDHGSGSTSITALCWALLRLFPRFCT